MPNKIITIQLQSVEYGGDNLGDDIRLDLTVNGASTVIRGAIAHGATRTFWKALYRFQSTNNTVRIPVSATVSEEDIVYNDAGSASGSLMVDLNGGPNQTLQSLKVNAIGSGGDKGDTGVFTLNFAAKLEDVYRFVPDVSRGWLRVRMEPSGTNESLPYTIALSYVKTERRREYFTILEGAHAGKSASVSLNDDGAPRFLTTDPRVRAVRLRFTKSTGVLEVVGAAALPDDNGPKKSDSQRRVGYRNSGLPARLGKILSKSSPTGEDLVSPWAFRGPLPTHRRAIGRLCHGDRNRTMG